MSEDKFLSDYSPRDAVWDTQRTLTDSVGVSTRLLLNSSAMHSVWPPVAVCYVLVGLPSWKPEKRAYGFVVRNFAVSVIALSASGEEPHVASPFLSGSTENRCGLPVFPMVVSDVNCQELRDR